MSFRTFEPPNLSGVERIVYDTETNGLDWKRNHTVGHVIALGPAPEDSFYFPTRHEAGGNYDPEAVHAWLTSLADDPGLRVIGHALKFDLHMSRNDGIIWYGPLECTQVNQSLCNENLSRYNLFDTSRYWNVEAKRGDQMYEAIAKYTGKTYNKPIDSMEDFWLLPGDDPAVIDYATGDGTSTYQVWQKQQDVLDDEELREVWQVECRVIRTLMHMERVGVRVDEDYLPRFEEMLNRALDQARQGDLRDLNVRSSPQIKSLLEHNGITDWPRTEKGNPSFTEDWLQGFELGGKIITIRKIENIKNSFLEPLKERHMYDGRVHTNYNQLKQEGYGVVSGRLSSNGPNMQQVPKRDKILAPLFRRCFIPEHGCYWSANDYKQQEYVVFAEYTEAPALVRGYNSDPQIDMHTTVAELLGVERDPSAKRINLAQLYRQGVPSMSAALKIPISEGRALARRYHEMVPEAKKFNEDAERMAKYRGYVKTLLGRRRRLERKFARKAGNQVIQGTCADITKLKMVEIDDYFRCMGYDCQLQLQVHDDLNWSTPFGCEDQDAEARSIMEAFGPNDVLTLEHVPLKVDHTQGPSWGHASFPEYDYGDE